MITNLARAAGDTGNIAVQERLLTLKAAATKWDSKESGHAVMDQLEGILHDLIRSRGIPSAGPGAAGGAESSQRTITDDDLRKIVEQSRPKRK